MLLSKEKINNSLISDSMWIFGFNLDILLFAFPPILAIFGIYFLPTLFNNIPLFSVLAEAHVFFIIFFGYGSKRFLQSEKTLLMRIPIFSILICILTYSITGPIVFEKLFTIVNAHHLISQQQAWFYISSNKYRPTKVLAFRKHIDTLAIYASTWGFFLLYMTLRNRWWFSIGDIFDLPQYLYNPLLTGIIILLSIYVIYHLYLFFKHKLFFGGQHFFLVISFVVYALGLKPIHSAYPNYNLFTAVSHAIPYYYLFILYMKKEHKSGAKFLFPFKYLGIVILAIILLSNFFAMYEFHAFKNNLLPFYFVFMAANLTHYFTDRFFWKKSRHPQGAAILDRSLVA